MSENNRTLTGADHGVIASLNELVRGGNEIAIRVLSDNYRAADMDAHERWAVEKAAERRRNQAAAADRDAEQRREASLHGQSRILEILKRGVGV